MDEIEKLIKMLESPKTSARYDACESLRVARSLDDAAIAALHRALNDPDPEVRDAAQRALNAHKTQPPHSETKTRGESAVFLRCAVEWVAETLPQVCLYCGQRATRVSDRSSHTNPPGGACWT
jgi:predicted glycoside hydrolase/deacetylase ChbG (UPF0249 family)